MLPSVVGTKPPHHAIRFNPRADLTSGCSPPEGQVYWQLPGFIGFFVPATGPREAGKIKRASKLFLNCQSGKITLALGSVDNYAIQMTVAAI